MTAYVEVDANIVVSTSKEEPDAGPSFGPFSFEGPPPLNPLD